MFHLFMCIVFHILPCFLRLLLNDCHRLLSVVHAFFVISSTSTTTTEEKLASLTLFRYRTQGGGMGKRGQVAVCEERVKVVGGYHSERSSGRSSRRFECVVVDRETPDRSDVSVSELASESSSSPTSRYICWSPCSSWRPPPFVVVLVLGLWRTGLGAAGGTAPVLPVKELVHGPVLARHDRQQLLADGLVVDLRSGS